MTSCRTRLAIWDDPTNCFSTKHQYASDTSIHLDDATCDVHYDNCPRRERHFSIALVPLKPVDVTISVESRARRARVKNQLSEGRTGCWTLVSFRSIRPLFIAIGRSISLVVPRWLGTLRSWTLSPLFVGNGSIRWRRSSDVPVIG
jgi:hypothetical protein